MRQRLAAAGLAVASLLVVAGLLAAAPARHQAPGGTATVDRLLPHAALITFPDGAFLVVPRGALHPGAAPGDRIVLQPRRPGAERLALATEPERSEGWGPTW